MSLEQEVELIRRFPIFSKIALANQKLLCFGSERLTYTAGKEIFKQGDAGDACYVVIEGLVEITVDEQQGQGPFVIATVGANGLFGEIGIFGRGKRTATATAKTRIEVLRIAADVFRGVIRENPDAATELLHILAERLATTTAQLTQTSALLAKLSRSAQA